jgi:Tol biopolymer transport system component
MSDRRPTDLQIAAALRAHLPDAPPAGLRDDIGQGIATMAQRRQMPYVLGPLTDADPIARRRAMLVAAAALLLAAIAGAVAVGAFRLLEAPRVLPVGAMGRMAYVSGGDLYVANPDGTGPALVAHVDGADLSKPHWSGNGRWIAVETAEPAILLVDMRGGDVSRVAGGTFGDWSPDSRAIAYFTTNGDIAVADVDSGTTNILVARKEGSDGFVSGWGEPLSYSPDGQWLIDDTPQNDPDTGFGLIRIDASSGETKLLDRGHEPFHYLADWAPDSRRVVFTVEGDRRGSDRLWVVDVDATETTEIRETDAGVTAPRWSPDGTWIAYIAIDLEGRHLTIAHPDGSDRRELVNNVDSIVDWSPDGSSIAYTVVMPDEAGDRYAVHVVTVANGDDRVLNTPPDTRDFEWAATTDEAARPDASIPIVTATPEASIVAPASGEPVLPDTLSGALAFRATPVGDVDCYVGVHRFPFETSILEPDEPGVPPSGEAGGSAAGTPPPMMAPYCTIEFAPDGSSFLRADQLTSTYEIVGLDGSVTFGPFSYYPGPPVWSTAGGWLATVTCDDATGECQSSIGRPDGTGRIDLPGVPTWLADDRAMTIAMPDGGLLLGNGDGTNLHSIGQFPSPGGWSPDGSTFVFVRDGDAWLAEADGSGTRNLTAFDLGGATDANWSPDGRWILVLQGSAVWALAPDGSARQRIGTELAPIDRGDDLPWTVDWSPDGSDFALETTDGVVTVDTADWSTVRVPDAAAPAWSPDGRFVAVAASGGYKVDVVRPDGSDRATVSTAIAGEPLVWLP